MHNCKFCNLPLLSMFNDLIIDNAVIYKDPQTQYHCANCSILVTSADGKRSLNCSKYEVSLNKNGNISQESYRVTGYRITYIFLNGSHWRTRVCKEDIFESSDNPHPSEFLWPDKATIFPFPNEEKVIQKLKTVFLFLN